jgi:hypothetical protein
VKVVVSAYWLRIDAWAIREVKEERQRLEVGGWLAMVFLFVGW